MCVSCCSQQNLQHSNPPETLQPQHQPIIQQTQSSLTGAISRTPARLPEDVTALADRDNVGRDRDGNKNAVTKTYHTLKDLISSKFKKDNNDVADELNNVVIHQQTTNQSQTIGKAANEEFRMSMNPAPLPSHMRQMQNLNQSQPNIAQKPNGNANGDALRKSQQERAASQPQLNLPAFERRNSTDIVTDSDDGGFKKLEQSTRIINRRPQTMYHLSTPPNQPPPHPVSIHSNVFQFITMQMLEFIFEFKFKIKTSSFSV